MDKGGELGSINFIYLADVELVTWGMISLLVFIGQWIAYLESIGLLLAENIHSKFRVIERHSK